MVSGGALGGPTVQPAWKIMVTEGQEKNTERSFISSGSGKDPMPPFPGGCQALTAPRGEHADSFTRLQPLQQRGRAWRGYPVPKPAGLEGEASSLGNGHFSESPCLRGRASSADKDEWKTTPASEWPPLGSLARRPVAPAQGPEGTLGRTPPRHPWG